MHLPIQMMAPVVPSFLLRIYFHRGDVYCLRKVPTASFYPDCRLPPSLRLCLCELSQHVDHDHVWLTMFYCIFAQGTETSEETYAARKTRWWWQPSPCPLLLYGGSWPLQPSETQRDTPLMVRHNLNHLWTKTYGTKVGLNLSYGRWGMYKC